MCLDNIVKNPKKKVKLPSKIKSGRIFAKAIGADLGFIGDKFSQLAIAVSFLWEKFLY